MAFRNMLIHGYAVIDDRIVWEVATERIEALVVVFNELLEESS